MFRIKEKFPEKFLLRPFFHYLIEKINVGNCQLGAIDNIDNSFSDVKHPSQFL